MIPIDQNGHGRRATTPPRVVPETPAHDIDLERDILASVITFPELIDSLGIVADDFYSAQNGIIYAAALTLHKAGDAVETHRVRELLAEQKLLASVGGDAYVLGLTDGVPLRTVSSKRFKRLARMRAIESIAHEVALQARADEPVDDLLVRLREAKDQLDQLQTPAPPHPVARVWKTLGDWGLLSNAPPARQWLLKRPHECPGVNPVGVLQLSKVGMLIAAGGVGKTIVLIQLALAVATGRRWLDYFDVASPGRVLIALAEEDKDELHRRFFMLAAAMRLTDEQVALASSRVVVLPLCGVPVKIIDQDEHETEMLHQLRARLDDGQGDWRLIILDPLSRFAGADTEKDNAAATRFVEAAETLLEAPGKPTVLIAHHTSKTSRTNGVRANASNARGASGLTDGARWAAELEPTGEDRARLTLTKSNYGAMGQPLELIRDGDMGGYLRAATGAERQAEREDREAAQAAEALDLRARALKLLGVQPDQNKSDLAAQIGARAYDVRQAVDELVRDGLVVKTSKYGYSLTPPPTPAQGTIL